MAPPSNPRLPVAPARATVTNSIDLILAARSKKMLQSSNLRNSSMSSSSSSSAQTKTTTIITKNKNLLQQDDFSYLPGNQGLGYKPAPKEVAAARDAQVLRARLLGRGKGRDGKGKGKLLAAESESDEGEGRTALGKRKRPRKPAVVEQDDVNEDAQVEEEKDQGTVADADTTMGQNGQGDQDGLDRDEKRLDNGEVNRDAVQNETDNATIKASDKVSEATGQTEDDGPIKKKRKKNGKNKKKKHRIPPKQDDNAA